MSSNADAPKNFINVRRKFDFKDGIQKMIAQNWMHHIHCLWSLPILPLSFAINIISSVINRFPLSISMIFLFFGQISVQPCNLCCLPSQHFHLKGNIFQRGRKKIRRKSKRNHFGYLLKIWKKKLRKELKR